MGLRVLIEYPGDQSENGFNLRTGFFHPKENDA